MAVKLMLTFVVAVESKSILYNALNYVKPFFLLRLKLILKVDSIMQ